MLNKLIIYCEKRSKSLTIFNHCIYITPSLQYDDCLFSAVIKFLYDSIPLLLQLRLNACNQSLGAKTNLNQGKATTSRGNNLRAVIVQIPYMVQAIESIQVF